MSIHHHINSNLTHGKDATNNRFVPLQVNSAGVLEVKSTSLEVDTTLIESNTNSCASDLETIDATLTAHSTKLDSIVTNTANIKVNAESVNLNTDTLESKLDSLVNYGGAGNNNSIGDGSVRLQTYCYGHDATNGKMKTLKLTSAGLLQVQSTVAAALPAGDNNIGNVDIASALPAGSNAIGKLAANSGVDIGDVDVTSISAGSNRIGMVALKANENVAGSGAERHLLCDSAGHLQIDVVSAPTTAVTGTVTANLSATDNTVLGNTLTKITNNEALLNSIDGGITDLDGLTDAIKTAVETVAAAVDTNSSNATAVRSDVYFEGSASETNSGNKNENVQRVCLATDDIPLALVNTKLDHLSENLDTIAPRHAVGTLSDAVNLADGAATSIVDTDGYRYMTVFGKATNDISLTTQYSTTNSVSKMVSLYLSEFGGNSVNNINVVHTVLEHPARYVRFINYNGSQINALTLYYQLSN